MNADRYPLSWPSGWKRCKSRRAAKFSSKSGSDNPYGSYRKRLSVSDSLVRLSEELRKLGVLDRDFLVSSNIPTKINGLPYSNTQEPDDPGVAVYFRMDGKPRCLACDTWTRVADNIAAVAGHVSALRAIDRYGVGTMEQAFAGYAALPAKGSTWRTTLGFTLDQHVTVDMLKAARRERAKDSHPDVEGGSHDAMASLNAAVNEGLAELGAQ